MSAEEAKSKAEGEALLRIAQDLRGWFDLSHTEDATVRSVQADIAVLERVGRWLSSAVPIDVRTLRPFEDIDDIDRAREAERS